MTERLIGETGSRKRRRFLILPVVMVSLVALLVIAGAQAVHDEGVFELEANAVAGNTGVGTGTDPSNPQSQPAGGDDWDAVYNETDSAEATAFEGDPTIAVPPALAGAGDSILSTNTKDIQAIADWDWKQTTSTSVQDKADIEHAYAAQYVVDKSGAGDTCGSAAATSECELLYFGADRFSNSGDTVMGFWFFRSQVGQSPLVNGEGTFTGSHTARVEAADPNDPPASRGDVLVVADFRSGGKAPQIQIYEWVTSGGSAATNLDLIGGGPNPASCTQAPPERNNQPPVPPVSGNDNFCATANQFVTSSPWPFLAKDNSGGTTGDGGPDTKFGVAEFMEGGINLTALGFGDTCFSSFMAETRSSHSVTSTLSDFVLGEFGACSSGIVTTPQADTSGTFGSVGDGAAAKSIGANARVTVRDHAELAITGTNGPFAGTVKFYLCGPLSLTSTENCSTGGVQIGSPAAGETVSGNNGVASLNSDEAVLTSAGDYCWRAEYSGDSAVGVPASVDPAKSVADGGTRSECFQIDPVQPTLSTTASADVILGNPISDTASLTGTAKQPGTDGLGTGGTINATVGTQANAGGSITWIAYGPNDCTTIAYGGPNAVQSRAVSGDGTYPKTAAPDSQPAISFTPTAIGKYTFVASYDGSSPNTKSAGPSGCPPTLADGDEEVNVTGVATLQTRQRWLPNDGAQITGPAGTTLSGNVVFELYNDGSCGAAPGTGTVQYTQTVPVTSGTGAANNKNVTTSNATFHVTANNDGTEWSWKVSYDDAALGDPTADCETTTPAFTLND